MCNIHLCIISVTVFQNFNKFHSMASHLRVYFETSTLKDPKMTWNAARSKVPYMYNIQVLAPSLEFQISVTFTLW